MLCILGLEFFSHPRKMELLLHGVDPLICLERFQGLLEGRWLSIHEVLERAVLIGLTAALVIPTAGIVSDIAQASSMLCCIFSMLRWLPRNCTKNTSAVYGGGGGGGGDGALSSFR